MVNESIDFMLDKKEIIIKNSTEALYALLFTTRSKCDIH